MRQTTATKPRRSPSSPFYKEGILLEVPPELDHLPKDHPIVLAIRQVIERGLPLEVCDGGETLVITKRGTAIYEPLIDKWEVLNPLRRGHGLDDLLRLLTCQE